MKRLVEIHPPFVFIKIIVVFVMLHTSVITRIVIDILTACVVEIEWDREKGFTRVESPDEFITPIRKEVLPGFL